MTHLTDDLPRLLTGDASRGEVLAAAEHLRGCPDCQQELVSAVVAHAALTSAQRFAPEVVAPLPVEASEEPAPDTALPDLSAVFARARADAAARPAPAAGPRRNRLRLALVGAAAAVVVGGATVAIVETGGSDTKTPQATTVVLSAFQDGTQPAKATVVGETMNIDATKLPRLDAQHFYEVWLTDKARTTMWPLGAIGDGNRARLPVPASVMGTYSAIEVSVQKANETKYSGTSVLRGSYG